ncbi:2-hydroxy-3-oxopropionate reductase [Sinorhizobium medicae]|uniref:2-hydroxy-3-oxopropionate reductase n=1 Tax=Sinorhizobium medicae TaxID=110321 RepID=UPI000360B96A|nr:2-hydroxy-3-oxopropionate reductase [Sinorhizobium medicae]MDX0654098.1 2-hydroxy-3-oxopropionate reductase [Sinorhizobium medicae]MQX78718.1 2-hydroxy-3-oxopropionate reductase [Sinorhizobium medicae]RVI52266.1 2-hydroxy-3-oxopropionate reductase [Sinorhizobium medicae]UFX06283.1 2-hydroxy-3-oxopropionate reductase [Sinorhizobium medicae WSM1115]
MRIGFIGLGVMGRPMAQHLIVAGHQLYLYRVKPRSAHLVESGATACTSASEVARSAEVIILMLPDTPDVEHVLFGEDGVLEGVGPGKLIIDMSSISPLATKDFAARLDARGCEYLDAPVSGGEVGAKAASLTIMVGGKPEVFGRAKPLFEKMGKNITLIGGVGDGQVAKVANQIVVALNIQAVSEALRFAARAGADPAVVRQALMGGFAASRVLEVHGERMISESFEPGFRIRLHHKDLSLALDSAQLLELMLPNTAMVHQLMNGALAKGLGDKDHSALIEAL